MKRKRLSPISQMSFSGPVSSLVPQTNTVANSRAVTWLSEDCTQSVVEHHRDSEDFGRDVRIYLFLKVNPDSII